MWVSYKAGCGAGAGERCLQLTGRTTKRFRCGPHAKAVCAADGLWSFFEKTAVAWQKNKTVRNQGESWEGMLQLQALQKPAEQPDVHWKVFQGLQRALHQAKGRLRGRHKHFISAYPTVKDLVGVLQTHSWLLAEVKQAADRVAGGWERQLPTLPLLQGGLASAAPIWLFPVQPSAPYAAITGVFGMYWARGTDGVVGNGREGGSGR